MKFFFSRKWIFTLLLWVATAFSAAAQYDKDVFSFRGRRALADGKNAEAIHNFNILASLDTADYQTFFFRGIAKYNLGEQEAINYVQWIQIGMLTGSIALPAFFNSNRNVLWGIRISCASLGVIFAVFIFGPQTLSGVLLQALLFCVGLFGGADILACTLGAKLSTPQTSGMIISWINSVSMFGEPVLQKCIGVALDHHWSGLLDTNGLKLYRAIDYECAMSVMLKVVCVCFIIACLMRNKKQAA